MIIPGVDQMLHDFGDRKYVQRKIKRCPFLINTHDTDLPIMHNCCFNKFFIKGGGAVDIKKIHSRGHFRSFTVKIFVS